MYLTTSIVGFVIILILSFANWNTYSIRFFFSTHSWPLTIPFLMLAIIGAICGASLAFYIQETHNEEDSTDDNDEY